MLKLIKHEFRRNRTSLLVMLGIAAALFLLAPLGVLLKREELMAISVVTLFMYCFAAYIVVLVRGVTAYSDELKSKSGYLLLMVPRSTTAILFSKLLFTLFFGLVMLGICVAALIGSGSIMLGEIYQVKGMLNIAKHAVADMGVDLNVVGAFAILAVEGLLGSVLSLVSACYLATTLSATIMQNRKGSGAVSVVLVLGIMAVMGEISELLLDRFVMPIVDSAQLTAGQLVALTASTGLPSMLLYLAIACLFTWISAVLLKKKVSL